MVPHTGPENFKPGEDDGLIRYLEYSTIIQPAMNDYTPKLPSEPYCAVHRHLNCVEFWELGNLKGYKFMTCIGIVFKDIIDDPFFWDAPLNADWVEELIKMVEAK